MIPGVAWADLPPPPAVAAAGLDPGDGPVALDVLLTGEDGTRPLSDRLGPEPLVLVMAWYRCPTLCGLVGSGLADVGIDDVPWRALTVSFDPDDRLEDALRVRARDGADWPYLVAGPEAIARLSASLGFRAARDAGGGWAHPAVLYVVAPDGRIVARVPGPRPDPVVLRAALADAAAGRTTGPLGWIDTCFRWTPAMRAHGGALLAALRIGSFGIVVLLAIFLALLARRR